MNQRKISGWRSSGADDFSRQKRDIFISHSSAQHLRAMQLVAGIEQFGLGCWIAPRDLVGGTPYMGQIRSGISDCQAVVLILTPEAIDSPHVKCELRLAESFGKSIVALRLADCEPGKLLNPRHTRSSVYDFSDVADQRDLKEKDIEDLIAILKDTTIDLKTKIIREAKYSTVTKRDDVNFKEILAEAKKGIRKRNNLLFSKHNRSEGAQTGKSRDLEPIPDPEPEENVFYESLLLIHGEEMTDPILPLANQLEQLGYALNYLVPESTERHIARKRVERSSHVVVVCGEQKTSQESLLAAAELAIKKPMIGICVGDVTSDLQYLFAGKHLLRAERDGLSPLADQILFAFRYPDAEAAQAKDTSGLDDINMVAAGCLVAVMVGLTYAGSHIVNLVFTRQVDPVFWCFASFIAYSYIVISSKCNKKFSEAEGNAFLPARERFESKHPVGCGWSFFLALILAWPIQFALSWFTPGVSYWYLVIFLWGPLLTLVLLAVYSTHKEKLLGSDTTVAQNATIEADRHQQVSSESGTSKYVGESTKHGEGWVDTAVPQDCPECGGTILLSEGESKCWSCGYRPTS